MVACKSCRQYVLLRAEAECIRAAEAEAFFYSSACEPACETERVVVTTKCTCLKHRHATKFGCEDHKSRVEKSALLEVFQKSCNRLVKNLTVGVVLCFEIAVGIPVQSSSRSIGAIEKLDKSDTIFNQSPRKNAVVGEGSLGAIRTIRAIQFANMCWFVRNLHDMGDMELHPRGQLIARHASCKLLVTFESLLPLFLKETPCFASFESASAVISGGRFR